MSVLKLFFHKVNADERYLPFLCDEEPIEYMCDGKEGSICFDGYYYVEDHAPPYPEDDALAVWERPSRRSQWLPRKLNLLVQRRETEPYRQETTPGHVTHHYFNILEEHAYIIEVYKRIIHESTDAFSTIDEPDGTYIDVCFFPTNRQTLFFRVLETLK